MNVSSISADRRNLFIEYSNRFMNFRANDDEENAAKKTELEPEKKVNKAMGIETLTIFPKQIIDGRTVITA